MRAALAHRQLGLTLGAVDARASGIHIAQAARLVPAGDAPSMAARILVVRAIFLADRMQFDRAESIARRALELDPRHEFPEVQPAALGVLGLRHHGRSEHAAAIGLLTRLFELAEQVDDRSVMVYAGYGLCAGLNSAGLWILALQYHDRYVARIGELGVGRSWGSATLESRVEALLALGRWREAESLMEAMLAEHEVADSSWFAAVAAVVWVRRGRVEEAAALAEIAAADRGVGLVDRLASAGCLSARAEVALAQGQWTELRGRLPRRSRRCRRLVGRAPDLRAFALLGLQAEAELAFEARIRRDADDEAEAVGIARDLAAWMCNLARQVTERGEPLAATTLPTRRWPRHCSPGWTSSRSGRLATALKRCEAVGNRYDIARVRHWLAEAILERGGSRSEATAELAHALATAAELGAAGLELAIRDLARRAHIGVETADATTAAATAPGLTAAPIDNRLPTPMKPAVDRPTELVEPLTRREHEVLGYVAAGWTNRRIGEALFISDKTVSVHVSNLMGKLGATNRAEAAIIGDRLGLVATARGP